MLWPSDHPTLNAAGKLLHGAGFQTSTLKLGGSFSETKLWQSAQTVVALTGTDTWKDSVNDIEGLANVLAEWATEHPEQSKSTDLYLLVLVNSKLNPEEVRQ